MIQILTERPAWKALEEHHQTIKDLHLRQLFADDPDRGGRFTAEAMIRPPSALHFTALR